MTVQETFMKRKISPNQYLVDCKDHHEKNCDR